MEEDIKIIEEMLILNKNRIEPQIEQAVKNLINKNKEQKRDIRDNHILIAKYSQKNEEQEKIIELMAKEIEVNTSDDGVNLRPATLKEKIDYFKKKASEENG